jgi:predicted nucleic acid-binding protein
MLTPGSLIKIIVATARIHNLTLLTKDRNLDTFILKNKFQTEDLLKSQNYQFEPLSLEILKTASEITDTPELHDRLIAATARYLDIPLITNDPVIRAFEFVDILE